MEKIVTYICTFGELHNGGFTCEDKTVKLYVMG